MKTAILLSLFLLISACSGGGSGGGPAPIPEPPAPTGLLTRAGTTEAFLEVFRMAVTRQLEEAQGLEDAGPGAPTLDAGAGTANQFSTTYTLEASVDEHDVVKFDGKNLYIAPSRGMACCFLFDTPLEEPAIDAIIAPPPDPEAGRIRILQADTDNASVAELGQIELQDSRTVEGLFVADDQLVAITSTAWWGVYGPEFEDVAPWSEQSAGVDIYDVSAPADPQQRWQLDIEGGFVNSRRVGNTLFLVTRHSPHLQDLTPAPGTDDEKAANDAALEALSVEDVLPRTRINGEEVDLIAAEDCLVADPEHRFAAPERGHPVVTTLLAVDLENPAVTDSLCYSESASGVYVSTSAIYITQVDYNAPDLPKTLIHRFDYPDGLNYRGSGQVDGDLRTGDNLDFRISESGDFLRLVTTIFTGDAEDRQEHYLHVLSPDENGADLALTATLPNQNRSQAIGKPNEALYGVRFLGDRAYLVTFEQIDPLYVIDLSDHTDPKIAGELEVPGFSDLLHPVTDALLLGVGQDAEGLAKLELFDISQMDDPRSVGALTLAEGANWSHSDARYDRHAFTYLADVNGVDRLAVPVGASFFEEPDLYSWEDRLYLLEIHDKNTPEAAQLREVGFLTALPLPEFPGDGRNRSVIADDAVFFIHGTSVWSAFWDNPFNQLGPN